MFKLQEVETLAVQDYYRLLGAEMEASGEAIKKAYRKLAMAYHPDRNRDKHGCEKLPKDISEAYRVLASEGERRFYDFLCQRSSASDAVRIRGLDEIFAFRQTAGMRKDGCKRRGMGMGCRTWK
jgi:DnaJ-class molecular chaperone